MIKFSLLFDADSFIRTEVRKAAGYILECDVAVNLMCKYLTQKETI